MAANLALAQEEAIAARLAAQASEEARRLAEELASTVKEPRYEPPVKVCFAFICCTVHSKSCLGIHLNRIKLQHFWLSSDSGAAVAKWQPFRHL